MPLTGLPATEAHGLIGDTRTEALVGPNGSIATSEPIPRP
jgi:hypothetical protein